MSLTVTPATGALDGSTVQAQNDRFRTSLGTDRTLPGRIVATQGVAALGLGSGLWIMLAVQAFSDFTEDNDPFGLHDFGAFEIEDEGRTVRLYWKIDLFDAAYLYGSEAPDDPSQTSRVLTILLPSEW